ncbi:hypothetical protein [Ralstonia sp.]|uniref:hypothetical protein n=1 Tax=Ralstonia sp. TaxID=54061 RepID=UPI002CB66BA1|nr:hypothetical protein [Ralstonia sp.]HWV06595.1 hypothetical protein [Ralstonia sp.]
MELKLEKPFRLHLDVYEVDERVPSMRMRVVAEVQRLGNRFDYKGNLWFDCATWEAFVSGLNNIEEKATELIDMDDRFVLRLGIDSGAPMISCHFKDVGLSGTVCTLTYQSPIDLDELAYVKSRFGELNRWW